MKIKCTIFENSEKLAEKVGTLWKDLQKEYTKTGLFFVSSPLSSTPLSLYQWIISHVEALSNWDKFRFILMDEQIEGEKNFRYVPLNDKANYERFAREKFLDLLAGKTNIPIDQMILKPEVNDLKAFDSFLENHGGIDLLILAIGVKGHYAQVMPGTSLGTGFHITKLISELAAAHIGKGSKTYEGAQFRTFGMSLGPKQVLSAKHVVVMITGNKKKKLAQQLFSYTAFSPSFPLSIIFHPKIKKKTRIFLTRDASGEN